MVYLAIEIVYRFRGSVKVYIICLTWFKYTTCMFYILYFIYVLASCLMRNEHIANKVYKLQFMRVLAACLMWIIHISSDKVYILQFIMVYLAIGMAHMLRAPDNVYIICMHQFKYTTTNNVYILQFTLTLYFIRGLYLPTVMQHASCNCKGIFGRVYILCFTMLCCYLSSI